MNPVFDLASLLFAQVREAEEERGRVYEPVIGIVTDNKDPQKLGRVKVKFPTISSDDTSWWAPLVAIGAGQGRGWFFLPEVDDEVLVMFEHGDISRPVVLGQLWNGKDKPPLSNADGKNVQRALVSRDGNKITFDDDGGTVVVEDGGGAATITLDAKNKKITLEAKQGDVAIHCKDDLTLVANEVSMEAKTAFEISSQADFKAGADANVTIKANAMLKVQGAQVAINNGGAQAPQAATASPAEVPDQDGGSGQASSSPPPQSQAAGGGGAGADGSPSSPASAPASAAPGSAAATPVEEPEPQPVLLLAGWDQDKVAPGTQVKLKAVCVDMAGKSATFTITDADDPGKTVATVSGSCGADSVEASWTTPSDGPPSRFVFTCAADAQSADSGTLVLVKPVEVTLTLDDEPAANVNVTLKVDPGGDALSGTADDKGVVKFEAPLGNYTLVLEDG